MRLSNYKRKQIAQKVIEDLYDSANANITTRLEEFAYKNHIKYLEPIRNSLKLLPQPLINKGNEVTLVIPAELIKEHRINDPKILKPDPTDWKLTFRMRKKDPFPYLAKDHWRSPDPTPIMHEYADEFKELAIERIQLHSEQSNMEKYVKNTLETCNTTNQLKKLWDSALHKYIPDEPKKQKTKRRNINEDYSEDYLAESAAIAKQRLTKNLLEAHSE